ncbi:MAG: glycosyltransferase family 9 protein [Cephaloticoccus sp.]|nr:glycosyltransferase family 9 protein [Cephaloticoccus sp.]MCF7759878.1 glycosyltransferase family 9 protein [Cephaloticoccus sp.]
MQRILVLRGGALGDFLVTLPALQALREQWPQAWIELIGNATAASLALESGLINRAESQHTGPWHGLFTDKLSPDLRSRLAGYDLILSYWPDPEGEIARHFPLRENQIFLSAPARPDVGPAAVHYNGLLQRIGIRQPAPLFNLRSPTGENGPLAVHPGSGSTGKNWPLERWQQLINWLQVVYSRPVHVIRGEAESGVALDARGQVWQNLPLGELADRLATCQLFIGHDSGVSHLAASCGTRGVVLFGPSDPTIWAPPTSRFTVVQQGATMSTITLEDVKTAVRSCGAI